MRLPLLLLTFLLMACSAEQSDSGQPVEIGTVKWNRDHDAALKLSAKSGKPVFLLFQEVPG